MIKKSFYILLTALLAFGSCKKDKPLALLTVKGTWKVVTDFPYSFGSYYVFTDGDVYLCKTDDENMHYISSGVYRISGKQLISDLSDSYGSHYTKIWEVETVGDTLYLHSTNFYDDIVLVKDVTGPATADNWTKQAKVLASYSLQDGVGDITWYGARIYYNAPGFGANKIYSVSTNTGAIADSIATINNYSGIEYNNEKLYVSYGAKVIRLSSAGAEDVLSPDNSAGNNLSHLAGTGNAIYAYGLAYLHQYTPGANSFDGGVHVGNTYFDLAYANGYMYVVKNGVIHQCTIDLWHARKSFYVRGYNIRGIAFDGTYFWCSATNQQNDNTELLKIEL